jgi:hypothetical protein
MFECEQIRLGNFETFSRRVILAGKERALEM